MQTEHSYSVSSSPVVMDVLPWPSGFGFNGADAWWQHTLSQSERDRLDNLMGLALLDHDVQDRLLVQHDPSLLDAFNLSDDTRQWLGSIQVSSLKELAQAIVAASMPHRAGTESGAF